ncbi:major capsid protein [Peromfec virus RodF7_17]|uniref:Major capsid protein n=1 Tax=Peromfec virus RodF7_17 TaxID=2929352 RepID=A0A976N1Z5_9VIRU|nr:major capsid protein [Peromfec virus RodF7_17]
MNLFNSIRVRAPKKNKFNLSHNIKCSTNFGRLYPFFCQETVPGDTFRMSADILTRMSPMVAPIMQNINVYTHFFFVPYRLIWDDFETFITGGKNGDGKNEKGQVVTHPYLSVSQNVQMGGNYLFSDGTLGDFLGYPAALDDYFEQGGSANTLGASSLPFRAYQQIYNDYYRDENLTDPIEINKGNGAEVINSTNYENYTLKNRAFPKDYFTSALPTPQRGAEVELPMGGVIGVDFNDVDSEGNFIESSVTTSQRFSSGDTLTVRELSTSGSQGNIFANTTGGNASRTAIDNSRNLSVDMSHAQSPTIIELRRALKVQEWLEKNARGGYRYIEQIFSHFGVKSSDARLQRAQYLGGGKSPILISDILQTSSTDGTSPQGNMAGHGLGVSKVNSFKYFAEEHGFIIGIMSILPQASYYQGLSRTLTRRKSEDYFWPEFAHLGEQEIKKQELYFNDSELDENQKTFGYAPRYSEYKYIPNSIHGDFRTNPSLQKWHLARILPSNVALNNDFVTCKPDASNQRIFAVTDPNVDKFYNLIQVNCTAIRPMPKYGTPYL